MAIVIHHPKLKLQSVVPRSTFENLKPKGWKEGALPSPKREKQPSKKESD